MYADDTIAECRREKSPVKLINAEPAVPHLEGAVFDVGKKDIFVDERNRLNIQVMDKRGDSRRILINPYAK